MKKSHFLLIFFELLFLFIIFVLTAGYFAKPIFAVDCGWGVSLGNQSITSQTCVVADFCGVYGGTSTTNTAILTLSNNNLTINSTGTVVAGEFSIGDGNTISILDGGEMSTSQACGLDADSDGYPANTTWTAGCATNYRALAALTSIVSTDCNDANASVHANIACWTDADSDTYTIGSSAIDYCATSCPAGTQTAQHLNALGADDCDDTDPLKWVIGIYGCGQ